MPDDFYAGETILLGAELVDRRGRPKTPQPDGGVTVQVMDDGEATTISGLGEAAASLQHLDGGTATGAQSTTTIKDTTRAWRVNELAGKVVRITAGTGAGQERRVKSNTADTLTIDSQEVPDGASVPQGPWSPAPSSDSVYRIHESVYLRSCLIPSDQAGKTLTVIARAKDAAAGTNAEKGKVALGEKAV